MNHDAFWMKSAVAGSARRRRSRLLVGALARCTASPRCRRASTGRPCRARMRCRSSSTPSAATRTRSTRPTSCAGRRLRRHARPGGYAHTFTLFDRAAMAAVLLPMGRISGDVITPGGEPVSQSARGFGDPTLEFNLNLIGPKAQKNIPDVMRYEPGFSLDVLADLAVPIGEYDNSQPLNLGQNRWYGRIGFPIVWQLGAGCRAGARPWSSCRPSGSSATTTTTSGRPWRPTRCSRSTRT